MEPSHKEKYAMCRLKDTPGISDAAGLTQLLHYVLFKLMFLCFEFCADDSNRLRFRTFIGKPLWASCPSQQKLVYPRVWQLVRHGKAPLYQNILRTDHFVSSFQNELERPEIFFPARTTNWLKISPAKAGGKPVGKLHLGSLLSLFTGCKCLCTELLLNVIKMYRQND